MRYCMVLQAEDYMGRFHKEYYNRLPSESDILSDEESMKLNTGLTWHVINVFPIGDD